MGETKSPPTPAIYALMGALAEMLTAVTGHSDWPQEL